MAVSAVLSAVSVAGEVDRGVDWRDQAICSQSEKTALFFPVGVTGDAALQIEQAKEVCVECPVRMACLEYAITTNQEYGVWGGTSEEERRVLRRAWRAEQRALRKQREEERKARLKAEQKAS
jgi:WhiB family transcriptional regulator, redox-sensing transcriptional regulator